MTNTWTALTCPQCGAPLPRIALWRSVNCPACGSLITRSGSLVTRDSFRQALIRARQLSATADAVVCVGSRYHLALSLGTGEISQVYLARCVDSLPLLVTLKLSSSPEAHDLYAREAAVSRQLQQLDANGAGAYFSILLPEVIACGAAEGTHGHQALVLRHPAGYWGSAACLLERFSSGIDPRHAVWIWRRLLEVLHFIHRHGWCHGDVRPEHALIHPQAHGVRLIGWAAAKSGAQPNDQAADLSRSARLVRVLLCGNTPSDSLPHHVPPGVADLLNQAGADPAFCRAQGAEGLDALLRAQALAAFGPPAFVPLNL